VVTRSSTSIPRTAWDIKPDSDVNPVNLRSRGVIPVALLGSEYLDVTMVDQTTLAFGPDGAGIAHRRAHYSDVNEDSYTDLLAHFRTQETGIGMRDDHACLSGELVDGTPFTDCDAIRIVPENGGTGEFSP
jgi:hypothetical protein